MLVEASEFDQTSTKPQDVRAFHICAEDYQKWAGVVRSCGRGGAKGGGGGEGGGGEGEGRGEGGVLYPYTIAKISEHISYFRIS